MLRIEDVVGQPQFGVRIDGEKKEVSLYIMDLRGDLQFVTFDNNKKVRGVSAKKCLKYLRQNFYESLNNSVVAEFSKK